MQESATRVLNLVSTALNLNLLKVFKHPCRHPFELIDLDLTEPNPPEMEGHEYGYAIFEPLQEINISNKSTHISFLTITSTIMIIRW